MSTTTTNYGLVKPELTDAADITAMNLNWDTIDTKLKDLENADSTATTKLNSHTTNKSNPHEVTKAQVGLGNVPNVATNDQTPTYTTAPTLATLTSGEKLSVSMGKIMKAITDLISHIGSNSNPHRVTASQVGAISTEEKGAAGGVASLDSSGKVPSGQLPEISSVKTYTATIGTTWTEDENTGVKYQSVAISGVLATHTAKVDHAYTGSGTSDDYAAFVEAENQYLTYITNGYAETYNGGVKFYIFGDAPTVSIPIVVEVS